jgi:hypothetical protein
VWIGKIAARDRKKICLQGTAFFLRDVAGQEKTWRGAQIFWRPFSRQLPKMWYAFFYWAQGIVHLSLVFSGGLFIQLKGLAEKVEAKK